MLDIIVNTDYPMYNDINYYSYIRDNIKTPIENCESFLIDLDIKRILINNKPMLTTNCFRYENLIYRYIRQLLKITDPVKYNYYFDKLINLHKENQKYEDDLADIELNKLAPKNKQITKTSKKNKPKNIFIRAETYNLFTGEVMYAYDNFATGESFVSSDPNLLEELNAPKNKKNKKKDNIAQRNLKLDFKLFKANGSQ